MLTKSQTVRLRPCLRLSWPSSGRTGSHGSISLKQAVRPVISDQCPVRVCLPACLPAFNRQPCPSTLTPISHPRACRLPLLRARTRPDAPDDVVTIRESCASLHQLASCSRDHAFHRQFRRHSFAAGGAMCKLHGYRYACGHFLSYRLSRCRATFTKRRRRDNTNAAACLGHSYIDLISNSSCGPCQYRNFNQSWE